MGFRHEAAQGIDHSLESRGDLILGILCAEVHVEVAGRDSFHGCDHVVLQILGESIDGGGHDPDFIPAVQTEPFIEVAPFHFFKHTDRPGHGFGDAPGDQ